MLELIELVLVGVEGGGQGEQGSYSFLTADDLDDATDLDDSRSGLFLRFSFASKK